MADPGDGTNHVQCPVEASDRLEKSLHPRCRVEGDGKMAVGEASWVLTSEPTMDGMNVVRLGAEPLSFQVKTECPTCDDEVATSDMLSRFGSSDSILMDADGNVVGLFVQDAEMRQSYRAYPEVLCVDATGHLLAQRMSFYLMLIEDSNGQSEIVALCILKRETRDGLRWFADTFRARNPLAATDTYVLMVDTEMAFGDVFAAAFPMAEALPCVVHTLRTFGRRLAEAGMSADRRAAALRFLKKMAHSRDQNEFEDHYAMLALVCPKSAATDHFWRQGCWLPAAKEWRLTPKYFCGHLLPTGLRLKTVGQRVTDGAARHAVTLDQFFDRFYDVLHELRSERKRSALRMLDAKCRRGVDEASDPRRRYAAHLTNYAAHLTDYATLLVLGQLQQMHTVVTGRSTVSGVYSIPQDEEVVKCGRSFCSCPFVKLVRLPCVHIFAVRRKLFLDLFVDDLCASKWTVKYYREQVTAPAAVDPPHVNVTQGPPGLAKVRPAQTRSWDLALEDDTNSGRSDVPISFSVDGGHSGTESKVLLSEQAGPLETMVSSLVDGGQSSLAEAIYWQLEDGQLDLALADVVSGQPIKSEIADGGSLPDGCVAEQSSAALEVTTSLTVSLPVVDDPTLPVKVKIEESDGNIVFNEAFAISVTAGEPDTSKEDRPQEVLKPQPKKDDVQSLLCAGNFRQKLLDAWKTKVNMSDLQVSAAMASNFWSMRKRTESCEDSTEAQKINGSLQKRFRTITGARVSSSSSSSSSSSTSSSEDPL